MTHLPWYAVAFGVDYLDRYSHRDEAEAIRHIDAFLSVAGECRSGPVLDLCCGGGRHLAALAGRRVRAVGLDLSGELLKRARQHTEPGITRLVRGDMRRLPFAEAAIPAVCHWFTAFGYFEDDEENLGVFSEIARVLTPGGVYLFDFLSAGAVRAELAAGVEGKGLTSDGRRVWKDVLQPQPDGSPRAIRESVRLFEAAELRRALDARGLTVVQQWGDYDQSPWRDEKSPRWIAVCRKRSE